MKTIKKNWVYLFFIGAVLFFIYKRVLIKNQVSLTHQGLSVNTFPSRDGFGYNILVNDTVRIHQDIIPSISGYHAFKTEKEAERVGKFAMEKMKKLHDLPVISLEELDSLGIKPY